MNSKGWLSIFLLSAFTGGCGHKGATVRTTQSMESHYQVSDGLYLSAKGEPLHLRKNTLAFYMSEDLNDPLRKGCENALATVIEATSLSFEETDQNRNADLTFHRGKVDDVLEHQASTRVLIRDEKIESAEVTFDEGRSFSQTPDMKESDAESVCLHELGHALGLAHSENKDSVMYYALETGTRKRSFSSEDLARLRLLYGTENEKVNFK